MLSSTEIFPFPSADLDLYNILLYTFDGYCITPLIPYPHKEQKMKNLAKKTDNSASEIEVKAITEALSAPFQPSEVKFKPAVVSGNRALALAYVDARAIQDRLDEVLGVEGWQDNYKCLEDGSVMCRLQLRLGNQWVTKVDVGGPTETNDTGDRRKAAFSDALKRAAVKFGIGRYLYRFPSQWVDYDPHKKQFTQSPKLPPFALPGYRKEKPQERAKPTSAEVKKTESPAPAGNLPANGLELQRRLYDYDAKLAKQGICAQGDLVKHVVEVGVRAGHDADLASWSGPAMLLAAEETRAFEAQSRTRISKRKEVA
jgi:hypothetical protein